MNDWREELVEKMAKAALESDASFNWGAVGAVWEASRKTYLREARAALAVAEPVIREQCAKIAEKSLGTWGAANALYIAAAIREGGKDEN